MHFNKFAIAKDAIRLITVAGSSKIVHDIIQNNTTAESKVDTAKILVGSLVLGSMITERVSDFTDGKFDEFVAKCKSLELYPKKPKLDTP